MPKMPKKILWGYFLKLLVADKLAVAAGEFFSHFDYYNNLQLFTGCLMFSIQLYADFLGYMYIVLGIAKIFGVELDENFRRPYFAQSLDEFWRRWHTSLGTWFRDYMFYPISMSKFVQNMGKKSRAKFGTKAGFSMLGTKEKSHSVNNLLNIIKALLMPDEFEIIRSNPTITNVPYRRF